MHGKKFWLKILIASLAAGSSIFTPEIYGLPMSAAIVHAEVMEYVGVGESIVSDRETLDIGKQGARLQAIRNAQKQAGVFISSHSVMRDHELESDEVIAFTAGIVKINDNVKYEPIPLGDDLGTIKYRATVVVTIDTDDLTAKVNQWFNRSSRDRSNIVEQDKDLRQLVDQQAKRIKELEQTIAAKDHAKVKQELSKLDNDTRIIEKTAEGNQAYYDGNYSRAAELYSDVLKLKEFEFDGRGIPIKTDNPAHAAMLARRAAMADAYRHVAEHLREYVEKRMPGRLENDNAFQLFINEMIKRSEITNEILNDDGSYSVKMRLRSEDVDKLKEYLESNS